jgi:small-conductance mechanosensitive channel
VGDDVECPQGQGEEVMSQCGESTPATSEEKVAKNWKDLFFDVRRSIRYHSERAGFFSFLNKMITAISIVAGSAVIATALGTSGMLPVAFGIIVASLSTVSLAFGYSSREQLHNELKREFIALERSMIKYENPDDNIYRKKHARLLSIEANEPTIIEALNIVCYNAQARAQEDEELYISWFRSLFCQIDFYTAISFIIILAIIICVFFWFFICGENKLNCEILQNLKNVYESVGEAFPKASPMPNKIY